MAIKKDAGLMQPPHIFGGKKLEKPESIVPRNIMKADYSVNLDDVQDVDFEIIDNAEQDEPVTEPAAKSEKQKGKGKKAVSDDSTGK